MKKRQPVNQQLSVIEAALAAELAVVDDLRRQGNEAIGQLHNSLSLDEYNAALKTIKKVFNALATKLCQANSANQGLVDIANQSEAKAIEARGLYEQLMDEFSAAVDQADADGHARGYEVGVRDGRLASEADHERVRSMWQNWITGSQVQ